MDPRREKRIVALGRTCARMTPKERREYLEIACDGDDELRDSVEEFVEIGLPNTNASAAFGDLEKAIPRHYRMIRKIGSGGMADVYLAEDKRLNRKVAIKFLNNEFRKDPERMRRFNQEARSASALNHPNIITIHDIGEAEENQFIVSEYVDGETLASRISRGTLPIGEALEIALQVASALTASHNAGIVHRDLKPENVMIREDQSVKVLDFGLAKETGNHFSPSPDRDARTLDVVVTSPGLILGTPQYMSPEQTRGIKLDGRSDVFSLGIIIFEMVTGKAPFSGNSMVDVIAAIIGKEQIDLATHVKDAPPALVRIVNKALRKNRDERYATMDDMLIDLKELKQELANKSLIARITGASRISATLTPSMIEPKTSNWKWLLALPLVAVLVGLGAWYFGFVVQDPGTPVGQLRTTGITSWNSVASEAVASAMFSPDARMIAFASTKTGTTEIWVKPAVGGDPIQVTKNGFYNQYPVWSPNQQEIAFFSVRGENQGIWRAAFTGGQEVQVANKVGASARLILWADDGFIYFQEGSEVFRVGEKSGEREKVTDFAAAGLRPRWMTVSQDTAKIAYSVQSGESWKLMVRDRTGGNEKEITTSKDQIDFIRLFADNRSIAYSGTVDGVFQILSATVDGSKPVQISNGPSDVYLQDISRDGTKFLTSAVNDTSDLWMVDVQDSAETLVANDVASEFWADVSPDGKRIAYQSVTQSDRPYRGSIMVKASGAGTAPVMASPEGFSPAWSNNGEWITFFKRSDLGLSLWRIKPDGSNAMKIGDAASTSGYISTPYLRIGVYDRSWSPDDTRVAFVLRSGNESKVMVAAVNGSGSTSVVPEPVGNEKFQEVMWTSDPDSILIVSSTSTPAPQATTYKLTLRNLSTGEQRPIHETPEVFRLLGMTNDGKNVVLAKKASPRDLSATTASSFILSCPLAGGEVKRVNTLTNAYFNNIHLSGDGRTIGFVSRQDDLTSLWTVPAMGGTPKRVLVENDPKVLISSLAWSPDSRTIVFGKQTRTNLITMLTK